MRKLILFLSLAAAACTNEGGAFHALKVSGYREVRLTGYSFSCAKDDGTCTGFEATAPDGERVEGAVGCGLTFKGCTIRLK